MFQNSRSPAEGKAAFAIRILFSGFLSFAIAGCAGSSRTVMHQEASGILFSQERPLVIAVDTEDAVDFIGYADRDNPALQAGAGILYPGNTAGVFLASVAAHALTASAVQSAAEEKLQTEANTVLANYANYLSGIEEGEIAGVVIKRLGTEETYSFSISSYDDSSARKSWVARVQPTYVMTQDQRQIMLRATIHLSKSETPEQIAYQNIIDVVSPVTQASVPMYYWLQQDELRKIAESLLYLSLRWMITDIMDGQKVSASKQETFQYAFGGENFYERGHLLARDCDYTATRNLRGWIRVFPASPSEECQPEALDLGTQCDEECDAP